MPRRRLQRLEDDERPSSIMWFLAGGVGPPPTGSELREWKRRDRDDKARKGFDVEGNGFWKELWSGLGLGFRRKKKEMKKDEEVKEDEVEVKEEEAVKDEEESVGDGAEGGGAAETEPAEEGAPATDGTVGLVAAEAETAT